MIIRRFIIRVPQNRQIGFTLFSSFLSNSVNRPHISRHMGLYVQKTDNLIGPVPAGGPDLVHNNPQNLVPPFLLHQVPVSFRPTDGPDLVHDYPQNLVPPFLLHQVPKDFRPAGGPDLVHDYPQTLVPPFPVHQVLEGFRPAAQISPGPPSDERRKAMRKAHRPSLIAFLHLNSKAERVERRPTALRSALHVIIPKGKVMRGGPRALLLIIFPVRRQFFSSPPGPAPSCPVPFRLVDRAKPARYAAGKSCELFSYDIYYDISYDIYYDMSMSAPCN